MHVHNYINRHGDKLDLSLCRSRTANAQRSFYDGTLLVPTPERSPVLSAMLNGRCVTSFNNIILGCLITVIFIYTFLNSITEDNV